MRLRPKCPNIYFTIVISITLTFGAFGQTDSISPGPERLSAMPILMYDSDTGLGFGGKAVANDSARLFDLLVFGSTKGEQWYAFAYSSPDPETRRERSELLSFDSKIEYKKVLKSCYFGIGNGSSDNDFQFPKESFSLQAAGSYSASKFISFISIVRYAHFAVYDYESAESLITSSTPGTGESQLLSGSLALRLDTRDSDINPTIGTRFNISAEKGIKVIGMDWDFEKYRIEFSIYHHVFGKSDLVASRIWSQYVAGDAPYQELSYIGDGWTARGYKAGRFLDRGMTLTSLEYRFPIYKKLGGVIFEDIGRVWHDISDITFNGCHTDYGGGLRYFLSNFLVRLDIGHSTEGTRIYFNFGHVF